MRGGSTVDKANRDGEKSSETGGLMLMGQYAG